MPTALIVGTSRGLGREFLRQYAKDGWRVHATTRSGRMPKDTVPPWADVTMHALDVRDGSQIAALAAALGDEPLDLLLHCAGVYDRVGGAMSGGPPVPEDEVFAVNRDAPMHVAEAVYGNLLRANRPRMVFISSAEGIRLGGRRQGSYGRSKAELNDQIRSYAAGWAEDGVIGLAVHPGWVRTDMGGPRGLVSPEDSVAGLRNVIEQVTPAEAGAFLDFRGQSLPW